MRVQSISVRLAATAAVIFIAVLVWRVGTSVIFNDHDDRAAGAVDSRTADSGTANSATGSDDHHASPRTPIDPQVVQSSEGMLALGAHNVGRRSPSLREETIAGDRTLSGWRNQDDTAVWGVRLDQVGDGYLRAQVRYRSLQAVRLELRTENRRLAVWTLPKARTAGLEEKLVRLKQPGYYELTAVPLGDATSLQLLEITLQPR